MGGRKGAEILKDTGEVLTIIPAKACSNRVKGKNLVFLGGRPLIARTIETALAAGVCGEVMVSTEDVKTANVARQYGAKAPFLRPDHMARDPYEVDDVCLHVLKQYRDIGRDFDTLIIMLPTSPFCEVEDVRQCMKFFRENDGRFLMSVSKMDAHYYHALTFDEDRMTMSPVFSNGTTVGDIRPEIPVRCNGAVTIVDVKAFEEAGTYYGEPLLGYEMPPERSVDIDDQEDLLFAEWLMHREYAAETDQDN